MSAQTSHAIQLYTDSLPARFCTMNTSILHETRPNSHAPCDSVCIDPHSKCYTPAGLASQKIFIALPAYNESEALPKLLERIKLAFAAENFDYEVIVVDDGSSDETADIARKYAEGMPIHLVAHIQNQGLGPTIRDCLATAVQRGKAHDIVVTLDADNTHPPELIPQMIEKIRQGDDIVVASRFQKGAKVVGVPLNRELMSFFARLLFKSIFPIKNVRDYTCGFRAYRIDVLATAMNRLQENFVTESGFASMCDILLKMRRDKPKISEVPLILRYDEKGGVSKMKVLLTIRRSLWLIVRRRFGSVS
jgi:dolichol-phosphate mannosyltransferase